MPGRRPNMILSEILAIHIGAGLLALFSGTAALLFRKGDSPHRTAGTVFFLSMLVLSASAIYIAAMKSLSARTSQLPSTP